MIFLKIFNISNKKFIIFENQSFEVTPFFLNHKKDFSIYIQDINQHFWVDSEENIIIIDKCNDKYLIDIFFPDIICPISNEIYTNPFNDINSLSYDLDSINKKVNLTTLKTVKEHIQKRDIHILNIYNKSNHSLYKNRTLQGLIKLLNNTKFIYTDDKGTINLDDLETFLFETTCPVYLTIMNNPLITPIGHSFENKTINKLLISNHFKCPLTKKLFKFDEIYINKNLELINEQLKKINIIFLNHDFNNKSITIGIKHNNKLKQEIDNIFKLIIKCKFWNQKKRMCKLYHTLFLISDIKSLTIPFYINILVQNLKENIEFDLIKKGDISLILKNKHLLSVYYSCLEIWFRYNCYNYKHFKKYFLEILKNRLVFEKNNISHTKHDKIIDIENFYKYPHEIDITFSINTQKIKIIERKLNILNKIKAENFSITSFYVFCLELLNIGELSSITDCSRLNF